MKMTTGAISVEGCLDLSKWWYALSEMWKRAFMQTCFQDYQGVTPTEDMLVLLFEREVFRFVGPSAPFPNMDFELTDLSGLSAFHKVKILVINNHQIGSIDALKHLKTLTNLFLQENQIKDLSAIQDMFELEELFVQKNKVESLEPIRHLTKLKRLSCFDNQISSLEGLTDAHAEVLKDFYCLPNENLSLREVVKTEKELYIACKSC